MPQNDKLYFENGIFNIKKKSFVANNIQINLAKDVFDNKVIAWGDADFGGKINPEKVWKQK